MYEDKQANKKFEEEMENKIEKIISELPNEPISYRELGNVLHDTIKRMMQFISTSFDESYKALEVATDFSSELFKIADYRRQRDFNFLIEVLSSCKIVSKERIYEAYAEYCKKHDELYKLNKEAAEDCD